MIRSMYAGVAGLRNHQVKMDVLGNNIANVNTYGYKAARASFSDMFSQTIASATSANVAGTLGGINPKQIGLGSLTSSVDVVHTAGSFQSTDRELDITIIDEGFFTVTDGVDMYYTRSGNLGIDSYGYLCVPGGRYVMGMMLISDGDLPENMDEDIVSKITEDGAITWGNGKEENTQISELVGEGGEGVPLYVTPETREEIYGEGGQGGMFGRIVIPSVYRQVSIDESGIVKGIDENGEAVNIAVIVTSTFLNPGGLSKVGDNLYMESANSGVPAVSIPGQGPSGAFKVGGLEMSNVDLANEMTSMIVTQRGYQSNSRVITVSDTLLEELVNLKR